MAIAGAPDAPTHSARELWGLIEPIHAVIYFSDATADAMTDLGLKGFWMGYFAGRFAPFGACSPALAEAVAYNFAPTLVNRALPDAWSRTNPDAVLHARAESAAIVLRRLMPSVDEVARRAVPLLEAAVAAGRYEGRPLAAANASLPAFTDPVSRMFQATTTLREHRGDGHVAALVAANIGGIESHVMAVAQDGDADRRLERSAQLQRARGWTADDWHDASAGLEDRGLIDSTGAATLDGQTVSMSVERTTDDLAAQPFDAGLTGAGASLLPTVLRPLARAVYGSGLLPFPNPIGLPAPS